MFDVLYVLYDGLVEYSVNGVEACGSKVEKRDSLDCEAAKDR